MAGADLRVGERDDDDDCRSGLRSEEGAPAGTGVQAA